MALFFKTKSTPTGYHETTWGEYQSERLWISLFSLRLIPYADRHTLVRSDGQYAVIQVPIAAVFVLLNLFFYLGVLITAGPAAWFGLMILTVGASVVVDLLSLPGVISQLVTGILFVVATGVTYRKTQELEQLLEKMRNELGWEG